MADLFTTNYSTDPWEGIATNQRQWYDGLLRRVYRQNTVYTDLVPFVTQPMLQHNARTMTLNMAFDFHANTDAIGWRDTTGERSSLDGQQIDITFTRYGFTTAMHKSDDLVNYWQEQGQSQIGLMPIIRERLSRNIVDVHDKLTRNAFLSTSYISLPNASYTGADQVTTSDTFSLDMIDDAILRAQTQNVWTSPSDSIARGNILCIDSPGQIATIVASSTATTANKWIELQKYASLKPFNDYEIGSYHSSRHLQTPANILYNCGKKIVQTKITASASEFDGSPDPLLSKVDGTYKVGQAGTNAVHYITVTSSAGFTVGDMVTFSKRLNQAPEVAAQPKLRVLGAPAYDDGAFVVRRIVAIVDGNKIAIDRPLLTKYATEINASGTGVATGSTGCYGFVTFGINLHVSIMIAAPDGIMCGIAVPPRVYAHQPLDDFASIYRFAWDSYEGFNLTRPETYEVFVTAGPTRVKDRKFA